MTGLEIGLACTLAIIVLVYSGMQVPIVLCLVSVAGVWAIKGSFTLATKVLALAAYKAVAGYIFGVVPLFVLMGLLVSVAGLGRDVFLVSNLLLSRVKGGLGLATVGANAGFAAVTGISVASAAVFTKIAVPEMIRLGYQPRFAVGVVAGSSVLGMLIPPSLLLIVYGLLAEQSVGDLFIAGIVPGLLLAAVFCVTILLLAYLVPRTVYVQDRAGAGSAEDDIGLVEGLVKMVPLVVLGFLVIGGIYLGWFTPTESGAVGALGAFILAAWRRQLTWQRLWQVLTETGKVTVSILFLIISANLYIRMLAISGMPNFLNEWVTGLDIGFFALLLIYSVIIVLMGTLLDGISIMLIMVPMFIPLLAGHDVNLVWFGIVTVIGVEIGLLTPPFGLSAFVIKSTLDDQRISLGDIYIGAAPYAIAMFLVLLAIIFIPQIALVLL